MKVIAFQQVSRDTPSRFSSFFDQLLLKIQYLRNPPFRSTLRGGNLCEDRVLLSCENLEYLQNSAVGKRQWYRSPVCHLWARKILGASGKLQTELECS